MVLDVLVEAPRVIAQTLGQPRVAEQIVNMHFQGSSMSFSRRRKAITALFGQLRWAEQRGNTAVPMKVDRLLYVQ